MSQLVVRPGRNAARQAKRLKEVRKVTNAIEWHKRERTKRQKLYQERWESRQAYIQSRKWEKENVHDVKVKALSAVREDWRLGNLRPNRAIGEEVGKYGALTSEQVQKPEIPVHTQKSLNEARVVAGLEPEYPLVVDDKKYFHIQKDDRVVVVNGREKGKIGIVKDILARTHDVVVAGVNMQYYDSDVFNSVGEDVGPMRENEVPMPIADVRLVIPYETTKMSRFLNTETGLEEERPTTIIQDVVVDKIFMERHTTGIDPFTGVDYGANEIPDKAHHYDPMSGLPIFHRYIAGTQHRIEWPWEMEKYAEDTAEEPSEPASEVKRSFLQKVGGVVRHPIKSLSPLKPEANKEENSPSVTKEYATVRHEHEQAQRTSKPKSKDAKFNEASDADTTRNIIEVAPPLPYTLLQPPFPTEIFNELRGHTAALNAEARKDGEKYPKVKVKRGSGSVANEVVKARHLAAQRMKTPMQLRWETEQASKVKALKVTPRVGADEVIEAVWKHMLRQRKEGKGVGKEKTEKGKVGKVGDVE